MTGERFQLHREGAVLVVRIDVEAFDAGADAVGHERLEILAVEPGVDLRRFAEGRFRRVERKLGELRAERPGHPGHVDRLRPEAAEELVGRVVAPAPGFVDARVEHETLAVVVGRQEGHRLVVGRLHGRVGEVDLRRRLEFLHRVVPVDFGERRPKPLVLFGVVFEAQQQRPRAVRGDDGAEAFGALAGVGDERRLVELDGQHVRERGAEPRGRPAPFARDVDHTAAFADEVADRLLLFAGEVRGRHVAEDE